MRFFASWWELLSQLKRFPASHGASAALLFLGAFAASGHIGGFIHRITGAAGMLWG